MSNQNHASRHTTLFIEWLNYDEAHISLVNKYTLPVGIAEFQTNLGNQLEVTVSGETMITPITRAECLALAVSLLNAYASPGDWPIEAQP